MNKMKMTEREVKLQQKIESGKTPDSNEERAYWLVFRALNKEVEFPLSDSFADRVAFLAKGKQEVRQKSVFDYILFGIGFLLLLIAFVVSIVMTGFKFDLGFLKGLHSYSGLILMGALLIIAFNLIDVRVIRKQHHQRSF